jgi:MFS family permease
MLDNRQKMEVTRRLLAPCALFWVLYGGAAGGVYGLALVLLPGLFSSQPLSVIALMSLAFGVYGLFFGAAAGLIVGCLGVLVPGRRGWAVAGGLGGAVGLTLALHLLAGGGGEVAGIEGQPWAWVMLVLIPALLSSALGWTAGRAVERRDTRLPGVGGLVASLDDARNAVLTAPGERLPGQGDVVPSASPRAQGSEPSPTDEVTA